MRKDAKRELLEKFSSEPDRYYRVSLFDELGFIRKKCRTCGRYFWTLEESREVCPNQPCSEYEFIGRSPTDLRLNYVETWKAIEDFFVKEGHTSISRYPVVARWRPDLYFTVASIIDFQRVEEGKIIFDLPANPLIVPQMSLRFNDVENVGVTGRHYTSFCMIGQHAYNDENGYWKDRTIELDFRLLTEVFKIPKEEVVFVEDVWLGYGAFGYSLEYFVRGLELGNAVFTEFEGTPENYRRFTPSVVDMGAGLERFVWLQHGTATSYDAVFGKVAERFRDVVGVEKNEEVLKRYYLVAGRLDVEELEDPEEEKRKIGRRAGLTEYELQTYVYPMESMYIVLDHARTLLFAIADGALPSNVGGGYNLRVVLRRALDVLKRRSWRIELEEVMAWIAESLKGMYPELVESLDAVNEIIDIERRRYEATRNRAISIVRRLKGKELSTEKLVELYDSHGITPELLKEEGVIPRIPPDFWAKLTERHMGQRVQEEKKLEIDVSSLPPTEKLFYQDRYLFEFEAKVLKVIDDYVILDRTAFYARAGGQEPDRGTINGSAVVDVLKVGDVILHRVKPPLPKEGQKVKCIVDRERRLALMRHHTATHIVNGAARKVLGPWVWQHSAFKEEDHARLDITHHSKLTPEQIAKIEEEANRIVMQDIPVEFLLLPRSEAERRFGFRIYQGGVVPAKELRIVNIPGFDVEACGGTHCSTTGEIGYIKILKSERVQDGIERLEFVAGVPAVKLARGRDEIIEGVASKLGTSIDTVLRSFENIMEERAALKKKLKQLYKTLSSLYLFNVDRISVSAGPFKLLVVDDPALDQDGHITLGDALTRGVKALIYIGIWPMDGRYRILIFSGEDAIKAGRGANGLMREIAARLGGSGGGNERLSQGGLSSYDRRAVEEVAIKYLTGASQG